VREGALKAAFTVLNRGFRGCSRKGACGKRVAAAPPVTRSRPPLRSTAPFEILRQGRKSMPRLRHAAATFVPCITETARIGKVIRYGGLRE